MIERVKDPRKIVTDTLVLKRLKEQGIDKDYVEFWHDYAPRSRGKEYSPFAKFYRDLKTGKRIMVTSGLPHVKPDGTKIVVGWKRQGSKYVTKPNLFSAVVEGTKITVTCLSDQPGGRKEGDLVTWQPQLFFNGAEQFSGKVAFLAIDPINPDLHQNTLEWDYGICKRRLRVIQGRIREKWFFTSNPNGEVRIKHNHSGNLKLKFGEYGVNDDEEIIPVAAFYEAKYPLEIAASPETFYPDAHIENTSVDGALRLLNANVNWATIVGLAESTDVLDEIVGGFSMAMDSDGTSPLWDHLYRTIFLFDTSGLPDGATVTAATLSLTGYSKGDNLSITPDANIYSSAPISDTALAIGDFDSFGFTPFATTIPYANLLTSGYTDFVFNNDGLAAISKTVVSKFGLRNANYDVAEEVGGSSAPNWTSSQFSWWYIRYAENGSAEPKLVVTYTSDVVVTPPTLALTITTYIPTIAISDNQLVTPPKLALVLTEYAPTVSTPRLVTPPTLSLVLITYAPDVFTGVTVTPSTLSLTITTYAPTISLPKLVTPGTLALSLTTYIPNVGLFIIVTPLTLSLIITTYVPAVHVAGRALRVQVITSHYRQVDATISQYRHVKATTSQKRQVDVISSGG